MSTDAPPLTDGEPLRASDAILWNIERDPVLRSTIVVVAVLDGTPDPARLRARLEALTAAFPRFRQRVASGARGRPRWVDAGPVELDHHLRQVRLPAPGNLRQVLDLGGAIAGTALDAARPLWELTVVEGLQAETTTGGEATAVILKLHHAVTDGVGGISLLSLIADDTPEGDAEPLIRPARPPRDPARVSATRAVADALAHPDKLAASLPGTVRSVIKILAPATSALSPLLTERGLDRHFEVIDVDLDELSAAGHAVGGTLNDAFLAATVGGLRHYHEHHGVRVEELRVTMPISTRRESDDTEGNRFTPARFTVPVGIADVAERMRALGAIAHAWQHEPAVRITDVLAGTLGLLPPAVTTSLFGSMLKGVDFVATNVPGRRERAWLAGVEVVRLYGFAPPSGSALSVALVSHGSTCCVGLTIDTRAVSDAAVLGDSVRRGFEEVVAIARRGQALLPSTSSESPDRGDTRHAPARLTSRLSALDASFLDLESPTTPMHIGALVRFEGGTLLDDEGELRLDAVRAAIATRLDRCPRMRQRLVPVPWRLGQPVWEHDAHFDIARHVRTVRLDPPGSEVDLMTLCCRVQMETLPRDRPLWEMVFVTGRDDGSVAVIYKVHHAVVDGVSAAVTFDLLFGEGLADVPPPAARRRTGAGALVAGALTDGGVTVVQTGAALLRAVQHPERAAAFVRGLSRLATNHLVGPPTSLHGPVRGERLLVPVRLSLDAVKAEGRAHDATVNDVLLARVTTGLRALLLSRGEHPDHALNALVPVSRRRPDQRGAAGNQVTALIVRLPVEEPDPAGRLAAIRSQTRPLKQSPEGLAFATLLGWADAWPPALVALTSKLVHHQPFVNIVVTNVPGPTATLTFLGAAITDLVPVVPLARNLGLGVAIVSYRGELVVGLHADATTCPDVGVMAAAMLG